jgi:hypothetical protein
MAEFRKPVKGLLWRNGGRSILPVAVTRGIRADGPRIVLLKMPILP